MKKDDLLRRLEIEEGESIEYFEQLADLLEMPENVDFETFRSVFENIAPEAAGEVTENYFEELVDAVPDKENELVSLIDSIEQNLLLLAENADKKDAGYRFAEQLYKFREWLHQDGNAEVDGEDASILEAVFVAREDKLLGTNHRLDFSSALDYELDDTEYGLGSFEKIDVTSEE